MASSSTTSPEMQPVLALLERLSQLPQVDIRVDFEDQETWSVITEFDDDDNQISLRYYGGDRYAWVAGSYDDSDDFVETLEWLAPGMAEALPEGCRLLMQKVRDDEKGLRLAGHFLLKQKG